MSNGYRPGVREVRPGEDPPACWDCTACGVGEPCFCASPTRATPCMEIEALEHGAGYACSLPEDHEGEHEAWALPDGGTFDARSELLSAWGTS